jgi:hypothetical protein
MADSPLHLEDGHYFATADDLLAEANEIREVLYENGIEEAFEAFVQQIENCFIVSLQILDREGIFGIGEQCQRIAINLLMGDQSDQSRITNAEKLNPPEVSQRLADELAARSKLWHR